MNTKVRSSMVCAALGAVLTVAGATTLGTGCSPFLEDAPVYMTTAARVVAAVAAAERSRRVTEAELRCGRLEEEVALARDVEAAARLLRELAEAQKELADAIEEQHRDGN